MDIISIQNKLYGSYIDVWFHIDHAKSMSVRVATTLGRLQRDRAENVTGDHYYQPDNIVTSLIRNKIVCHVTLSMVYTMEGF